MSLLVFETVTRLSSCSILDEGIIVSLTEILNIQLIFHMYDICLNRIDSLHGNVAVQLVVMVIFLLWFRLMPSLLLSFFS